MLQCRVFALLGSIILVASCAPGGKAPSPKAVVLAMEVGLEKANRVAVTYARLPACTPATKPVCSEPATVAAIKAQSLTAYEAITGAQALVDVSSDVVAINAAVQAAQAALNVYIANTAALPAKP